MTDGEKLRVKVKREPGNIYATLFRERCRGKEIWRKILWFFLDVNSTWIVRVIGTLMLSYV